MRTEDIIKRKELIIKILEEDEGVLTPELERIMEETEHEEILKTDKLIGLMEEIDAVISTYLLQLDQTKAALSALEAKQRKIKEWLHNLMVSTGTERLQGSTYKIIPTENVRNIIDITKLPEELTGYTITISPKKLNNLIEAGHLPADIETKLIPTHTVTEIKKLCPEALIPTVIKTIRVSPLAQKDLLTKF